jgi:hypothetical protein
MHLAAVALIASEDRDAHARCRPHTQPITTPAHTCIRVHVAHVQWVHAAHVQPLDGPQTRLEPGGCSTARAATLIDACIRGGGGEPA